MFMVNFLQQKYVLDQLTDRIETLRKKIRESLKATYAPSLQRSEVIKSSSFHPFAHFLENGTRLSASWRVPLRRITPSIGMGTTLSLPR